MLGTNRDDHPGVLPCGMDWRGGDCWRWSSKKSGPTLGWGTPSLAMHWCCDNPLVNVNKKLWKMAIYSGFSHEKWWFSIAMLVYQRVTNWKLLNFHLHVHLFENRVAEQHPRENMAHHLQNVRHIIIPLSAKYGWLYSPFFSNSKSVSLDMVRWCVTHIFQVSNSSTTASWLL